MRQVRPGLDLDLRAAGERGDLHRRAGRAVVAERLARRPRSSRAKSARSVTNTVVFATSVTNGAAVARARRRCCRARAGSAPCASPSTKWPRRRVERTWPASTSQSPARTAGEYGPATGGALGVGTGSTVIGAAYGRRGVPTAGNVSGAAPSARVTAFHVGGRNRREHRVRRERARPVVGRDDLDRHRRHRLRPDDRRTSGS